MRRKKEREAMGNQNGKNERYPLKMAGKKLCAQNLSFHARNRCGLCFVGGEFSAFCLFDKTRGVNSLASRETSFCRRAPLVLHVRVVLK
jgi:hypothetical protein